MTYNPKKKRKTNKDIDYNNSSQLWDPGGQPRPQDLSLKNHPFFEGKSPGDEVWYTPTKNSRPTHFLRERPWGLGWGCTVRWWLVLQILALFQTKKCHFAQQFSDLAPCFHRQKLCHHQSNAFKTDIFAYYFIFPTHLGQRRMSSLLFGNERTNTLT